MLDLALAIAHHLAIFALFGVLVAEFALVKRAMPPTSVDLVATIDLGYGVLAGVILIVGFTRAIFAAKGWAYYSHNAFFWAKVTTFLVIGLLSVPPTVQFIQWRRAGQIPPDDKVAWVRRLLHAQLALFVLLPIFAAAMARGLGQWR